MYSTKEGLSVSPEESGFAVTGVPSEERNRAIPGELRVQREFPERVAHEFLACGPEKRERRRVCFAADPLVIEDHDGV